MNADQFSGKVVKEGRLSLNNLPDELLTEIFNRIIDLKCLCLCSLVSPRFTSLILFHVHSVHFTVPCRTTDPVPTPDNPTTDTLPKPLPSTISSFYGDSFLSALSFLRKFKSIRSLHLVLPSSLHKSIPNSGSLFKWTAKLIPTIDTFVFIISTSTIRVGREFNFGEQEEEDDPHQWTNELLTQRVDLALDCLNDANFRHIMICILMNVHPLLHNIAITDSKSQGNLSLKDSKVVEKRNSINLSSLVDKSELERVHVPVSIQQWHVPALKLPVSRKVMMNATLFLIEMVDRSHQPRDWTVEAAAIAPLFSEQGDEEFAEAIVEMMVTHKNRIIRLG